MAKPKSTVSTEIIPIFSIATFLRLSTGSPAPSVSPRQRRRQMAIRMAR
jgi:hypothetical protein